MPPPVQNLVLVFTHARRSVEAPSTLSLTLATLPAPEQWGVWVRRASVVLTACPMAVIITIRGSTIDCISKRQGSVSNSTAASELKAMLVAVHKTTIVRTLFAEIGVTLDPVRVLTDSQVALDMLKRGHPSTATKHLAQVYYEVKEAETNGMCVFTHTPGVDNISDIATKPLTRVPFTKHRDNMLNDLGPKPTYAETLTGVPAGE